MEKTLTMGNADIERITIDSKETRAKFVLWCGLGLFLWFAAMLGLQAWGWLKFGVWQEVPLGALFLSTEGTNALAVYRWDLNPLSLVPKLGNSWNLEAVAAHATSMIGLNKIILNLCKTSLPFATFAGGSLVIYIVENMSRDVAKGRMQLRAALIPKQ